MRELDFCVAKRLRERFLIFSPSTAKAVPLPRQRKARKKAVPNSTVFKEISKSLYNKRSQENRPLVSPRTVPLSPRIYQKLINYKNIPKPNCFGMFLCFYYICLVFNLT